MIIVLFSGCREDNTGFVISGQLENPQDQMKVYFKNDHTGIVEDSTIINESGSFSFKGITAYPQRYSLIYQVGQESKNHFVWVENTAIEITGKWSDIENIRIKAGKEHELSEKMALAGAFFYPEYNRLAKEQKYDSIGFLIKQLSKVNLDFCIKNADSYVAVETLYRIRNEINKDSLVAILENMSSPILKSKYGESLMLYAKSPELKVGDNYVDFTAKTLDGEEIRISESLKEEKPILLIFGGLACMEAHGRKILKDFHSEYKDKVEILAFVFASNPQACQKEAKYSLDVTLISDLKGDHSPIKIQYGVQVTPTVYVINTKGIITWKSIGYGSQVNEAVRKLLDA